MNRGSFQGETLILVVISSSRWRPRQDALPLTPAIARVTAFCVVKHASLCVHNVFPAADRDPLFPSWRAGALDRFPNVYPLLPRKLRPSSLQLLTAHSRPQRARSHAAAWHCSFEKEPKPLQFAALTAALTARRGLAADVRCATARRRLTCVSRTAVGALAGAGRAQAAVHGVWGIRERGAVIGSCAYAQCVYI